MTEYIRPEPADYDSFPESQISVCGMETIQADMKKTAVRLKHMVRYCTMDGMDLHMNIHIPERQGKLPLAVFIPGSAWRAQRIRKKRFYYSPDTVQTVRRGPVPGSDKRYEDRIEISCRPCGRIRYRY